ncbi:unnamed protein product [Dicrocoelium dendriticum]|nr:unnamed protein product [Dicrocoelium dendriticum]
MRVKRNEANELSNALKQLKITDRRSRVSTKSRVSKSAIFLTGGRPVDHNYLRSRSISSTASRIDGFGGFRHICEHCAAAHKSRVGVLDDRLYRQSLEETLNLDGPVSPYSPLNRPQLASESGFSPFNRTAGLLYSTLPTSPQFPVSEECCGIFGRHFIQSSDLRRSCGTELGHLAHGFTICTTSASHSSISSVSTTHCARRRCFSTYNSLTSTLSTQVKLGRRLCSLIDHPCTSLYHSSRSIASAHSTHGRPIVFCRNRHTVTPTSPFCSEMHTKPLPNYDPLVPSNCVSSLQHTSSSDRTHEGFLSTGWFKDSVLQNGLLSGAKPISPETSDSDNDQFAPRCRRKSDPEYWQQLRANESKDSDEVSKINRLSTSALHCTGVSQPSLMPTSSFDVSLSEQVNDHTSVTANSRGDFKCPPFGGYTPFIQPCERNTASSNTTIPSYAESSMQAPSYVHSVSHCFSEQPQPCATAGGSGDTALPLPMNHPARPKNLAFSFRTPILSSHEALRGPSCALYTNGNAALCVSDSAQKRQQQQQQRCGIRSESHTDSNCTPTNDLCTVTPVNMTEPSALNLDSSLMAGLQTELSSIDRCGSPGSSTAPGGPLCSDVSVNELASYMEYMVHIPGRMSEMAQRMYL